MSASAIHDVAGLEPRGRKQDDRQCGEDTDVEADLPQEVVPGVRTAHQFIPDVVIRGHEARLDSEEESANRQHANGGHAC